MKIKHFTKTQDFTKEEYLEICRRAKIFQQGIEKQGKSFTHLCPGKVLATMFFQESTRTSIGLQSAIIKLGGGYIGISGTAGTYLDTGEEDIDDFLNSFTPFCDLMAVRHKFLELNKIADNFPVPLINAMCGGDEHSIAALGMAYSMYKRNFKFEDMKYGIYGMIKSSRPAKAYIRALSILGATIYEDPVVEGFETPLEIRKFCEKIGGKIIKKKLDDFISEVDFLHIVEGLPQSGENQALVDKYNKLFKILGKKDLNMLKSGAFMFYSMPRKLTDGRMIIDIEIDNDPRVLTMVFMQEWVYVLMGLYTYLLKIDVKE